MIITTNFIPYCVNSQKKIEKKPREEDHEKGQKAMFLVHKYLYPTTASCSSVSNGFGCSGLLFSPSLSEA